MTQILSLSSSTFFPILFTSVVYGSIQPQTCFIIRYGNPYLANISYGWPKLHPKLNRAVEKKNELGSNISENWRFSKIVHLFIHSPMFVLHDLIPA